MQQKRPIEGLIGLAAALCLLMTACSDDTPPAAQDFPPLHYDYLTPIRLNIATVDVENQADIPDGDLASRSPEPPEAALERMARDRLVAAGPSGTGTFTVTEASITRGEGGGLTERLSAHLDIASADGARAGYAEAHVTRTATGDDASGPAALYDLTRLAMQDMNVEFEYQVRHSLHDWIVSASAVEAPVEQAPLGSSGPLPLTRALPEAPPPQSGAPLSLAPPPQSAPAERSPPPGFLAPPPGAAPQADYPPPSSQAPGAAGGGY